MFQKSGKNFMKRKRYNKKMFIFPLIVWTIGFIISFIRLMLENQSVYTNFKDT